MVAVLTLVEPQSSGIGGGGFMLHSAKDGSISTIDGRETAPAAAKPERFPGPDRTPRPYGEVLHGGLSGGVPGTLRPTLRKARCREKECPSVWSTRIAPTT